MVTKKKKADVVVTDEVLNVYNDERLVSKKDKEQMGRWPKVTKGSHLTVTTYEDGRTELEWDDDALMRDVQEAIASVQVNDAPLKKSRKKKE